MEELALAIISSVACIYLVFMVIRARAWCPTKPMIPCRPSTIVLLVIVCRYILGGWLVVILGNIFGVPEGEYGQYIVTYEQGLFSVTVWCTSVCVGWLGYMLANRHIRERDAKGGLALSKGWNSKIESVSKLKTVCALSLCLKMTYVVVSSLLGSEDRGDSYTYWALMEWKPTAALIAINRLMDLGYVLAPFVLVHEKRKSRKAALFVVVVLTILLMALWGGRGEVLYPVVYLTLGSSVVLRKRFLISLVVIAMAMSVIVIPTMSALRDMPVYGRLGGIQRLSLVGELFKEKSSIGKRLSTIGRDIYACSDGYIYRDKESKAVGINGVASIQDILRHAVPRVLGGSRQKSDGSDLAQSYMGSKVEDWFPCISLPADLFRRFKWSGVISGAAAGGVVMAIADGAWGVIRRKSDKTWGILLTMLPLTMIRSAPTGTLKEIVGTYPWETVKYALLCWVVGYCIDWETKRRLLRQRGKV